MSRNVLLVLSDAAEAKAIRRSLVNSRDGSIKVEWVCRCADASSRLGSPGGEEIAAVVVDLSLPDSQGIHTFDALLRASPHVPILVLSHLRDEDVARLAVQHGAQDYLLQERLDGYSLSKALSTMLERTAYAKAMSLERERAQVTLNSIGDAVISTDIAGNVT
jgi:DNA-binding NarL/FixJ family response regulator